MINLLIIITLTGCYAIYSTSQNIFLPQNTHVEIWMQNNRNLSKIIGSINLMVSLFIAISLFGQTSGVLIWFLITMILLSLLIVLVPTNKLTKIDVIFIFAICLILEYLL
ncbi:hypothetical protein SAMN04489761_3188 [Tenacibaculum sp. MAR_2009_124]|uniref:hypothetical protein n=1 Tax=Tenacibaculum sp. MAR_2009_124 TaxID=1250059 RepID=UPI00089B7B2E|nr:hypothetical protein [Tenacibaculum sp. MAR_2009_124]SEC50984.1 hypothetical protein SAMN04489761_3188 [Tenacibaculum sp. MAR_2009_124]